jgi:hypothetical protein
MALMVFLALMSMVVLYWVPVAMEGNEKSHMNEVIQDFSDLRNMVEDMVSSDIRNETRGVTIDLGADGYPMFERETPGQLSLMPSSEWFNFSFSDSGMNVYENSSGSIEYIAYNRFYVRQTLIYENGAMILHQSKGDVIRSEPSFLVEVEGSNVILDATLISLYHETEDSIAGTSSEDIKTRLWYTDRWTYSNIDSPSKRVNMTLVTKFADAWENFYNLSFANAGLTRGIHYDITSTGSGLEIYVENVSRLTLNHAFVEANLGRGAT